MNKAIGKTSSCYSPIWSATPSAAQRRLEAERFGKRVGGTKGTSKAVLECHWSFRAIPEVIIMVGNHSCIDLGGDLDAPGAFEGLQTQAFIGSILMLCVN